MSEHITRKVVRIENREGLHVRPSALFVKCASEFASEITIFKRGEEFNRINGKSVLGLITLVACKDTELVLEAEGEDATEALDALEQLIKDKFYEE